MATWEAEGDLSGNFHVQHTAKFSVISTASLQENNPVKNKVLIEKKEVKSSMKTASEEVSDAPKSFARRDHLNEIAKNMQEKWRIEKVFEANVMYDSEGRQVPKFFATFPYPYMNGRLHLGHAYSLTKADFMTQFQRIKGVNVLFPFGFHCTGMPIQAAANRLKAEIQEFGCPPNFPTEKEESLPSKEDDKEVAVEKKGKGKKAKLTAKTGGGVIRQWDIMKMMVPENEIEAFTDSLQWLKYFPPHGKADLERFGAGIDWRRSFITTSINPYYDSFIRWQFNTLRANDKVRFGKRANVYSILDGQVCADHDRSSGEGVGPQEYTLIKLKILALKGRLNQLEGNEVFLAAATLRPETMYGQTNCFVLPEGVYGAYKWADDTILIMSFRSAKGLAHQGYAKEWGKVVCVIPDLTGQELMGLPLRAPNAQYDVVYTLPLLTISMNKGTGVVTSVPSDAPDDYAALKELKEKPQFRAKFELTDEMVMPFEVVPIIDIPGYGNRSAEVMCEKLKIKSCKDTEKLKQAKEEVYLKGFYEGIMEVGPYASYKVCDAKPLIRQEMIQAGQALPYYEPESTVMSRSGEECIVAFTDQWYLPYGEEEWAKQVGEHVNSSNFNAYQQSALDKFNFTLGWLKEWACTRLFGLGTKLPWDESWVIESLSDSTIYMAYYTIAHLIHGTDNLDGTSKPSPSGISPAVFTDQVWDYVFLAKPMPEECSGINSVKDVLEQMKAEFEYWYPMDLRCSAKELIPNHLTMALYNHTSIWKDRPELWPRSYWTNGHILVDKEKMSKSLGNFLMMDESVQRFSADATRFACANAGDSLLDANFEVATANNAIILLTKEEEWIKSVVEANKSNLLRNGPTEFFMDRAFENEMNRLITKTEDNYSRMMWREGLQIGFFEMQLLRDSYRDWCTRTGTAMHAGLAIRFIEAQIVMLAPICPHFCEFVWGNILNKSGTVLRSGWPSSGTVDIWTSSAFLFLQKSLKNFRVTVGKAKAPPKQGQILVAVEYPQWKQDTLVYLQSIPKTETGAFPEDYMKKLRDFGSAKGFDKKQQEGLMQFAAFSKAQYDDAGLSALDITLAYDQKVVLEQNIDYACSALGLEVLSVHLVSDSECPGGDRAKAMAAPGHPVIVVT